MECQQLINKQLSLFINIACINDGICMLEQGTYLLHTVCFIRSS